MKRIVLAALLLLSLAQVHKTTAQASAHSPLMAEEGTFPTGG